MLGLVELHRPVGVAVMHEKRALKLVRVYRAVQRLAVGARLRLHGWRAVEHDRGFQIAAVFRKSRHRACRRRSNNRSRRCGSRRLRQVRQIVASRLKIGHALLVRRSQKGFQAAFFRSFKIARRLAADAAVRIDGEDSVTGFGEPARDVLPVFDDAEIFRRHHHSRKAGRPLGLAK